MGKAVKYSIQDILEAFPHIEDKTGYQLYVVEKEKDEIIRFVRQNKAKFIAALAAILGRQRTELFKDGPECTKEFRFVKSGKLDGAIRLNSRIYAILKGEKIILCHFLRHKNREKDKVPAKDINILKALCKEEFEFIDKKDNLIEMTDD